MATNREALQDFMMANAAKKELISGAMRLMEPFFKYAESGEYPLSSAEELDPDEVAKAISHAVVKQVKKIIFVSGAEPFLKPDWMTQKVYETNLSDSVWASLKENLRTSLEMSLETSLSDSVWASLKDNLSHNLWTSLRTSLEMSLRDSLGDSLGASHWASLIFYLGFTLAGDQEKVEQLTLLIELFPHAIPLGEKGDEPGTWLVVCA